MVIALTNDYYNGLLKPGFYYIEIDQPDPNKIVFDTDYYDGKKFMLNKVKSVNKRVPRFEEFLKLIGDSYFYNIILEHYDGKFTNWVKEFNARKS